MRNFQKKTAGFVQKVGNLPSKNLSVFIKFWNKRKYVQIMNGNHVVKGYVGHSKNTLGPERSVRVILKRISHF